MRVTPLNGTHVTRQQSEILDLIAAGLADKEIAERLGLSYGTVRTQLGRFFAANGVRGRAGAAALWVRTKPPSETTVSDLSPGL